VVKINSFAIIEILLAKEWDMKKPKFLTNWKTTAAGVVTAGAIIFPQVQYYIDDDPTTNPEWKIVLGAVGVLLGFAASRDGDKSSQGKKI